MTLALFDGDVYAFRSASSCSPTKAKPFLESEEDALFRVESMVQRTFKACNPTDFKFFLGGRDNFRKTIYPEYKANRKDVPKPVHLEACRKYLISSFGAIVVDGMEADDMLSIEQHAANGSRQGGLSSIICTNDKDMRTVPGNHFNPVTEERFFVSPFDALRYFYSQVILGDGADNIPGFDGKLRSQMPQFIQDMCEPLYSMTEEIEMYEHVAGFYSDVEILNRNCQLLYILKKENEFWSPPTSQEHGGLSN